MDQQSHWEKEVRDVFQKTKAHQTPYAINIRGIEVTIFPNVFSPAYFTDSDWFAKVIPGLVGQSRFLEIGTGTGIVALFTALNGATVTTTDINPAAVENAKFNFAKHHIRADVFLGDMYEALPADMQFDVIFWNHPFNRGDDPHEETLLKAGFDYQYQSLERYIRGAKSYLSASGRLLLGTGSFALLEEIARLALKYGYLLKLLDRIEIPLAASSEIENDYRVYELVEKH